MNSENKKTTYALVTGGTSGIGLAFVHQLAAKAYNIFIVSIENEKLELVKNEIETKYGVKCATLFLDLANENAAKKVYDFSQENALNIELLINNAGFLIAEKFVNVAQQKISAMINLHIFTSTMLCHYFAKEMVKNQKGYILNISSTSAFMPYPLISLYGPSKAYIRNFTRAIRNELYSENINVSCIMPGAVDTNLYEVNTNQKKFALRFGIMHTPEFIAKRGLQILFRNQAELVPGFLNKASLIFIKFVPDFAIRKMLHFSSQTKK